MKSTGIVSLLAASMLLTAPVQAAVEGSLVFTDPTGTVSGSETINVWATLTLAAGSDPFTYYKAGGYPNGVNEADMPSHGRVSGTGSLVPFDSYGAVGQFMGRNCDDTFAEGCSGSGSAYSYETITSGDNSWFSFEGTIYAGGSLDFLLYQLTPVGGMAGAGVYKLYTASLGLNVHGLDESGGEMSADIYSFSTTCGSSSCTFTRTVADVPIPAAAWLFGSALLGLGAIKRRKV